MFRNCEIVFLAILSMSQTWHYRIKSQCGLYKHFVFKTDFHHPFLVVLCLVAPMLHVCVPETVECTYRSVPADRSDMPTDYTWDAADMPRDGSTTLGRNLCQWGFKSWQGWQSEPFLTSKCSISEDIKHPSQGSDLGSLSQHLSALNSTSSPSRHTIHYGSMVLWWSSFTLEHLTEIRVHSDPGC